VVDFGADREIGASIHQTDESFHGEVGRRNRFPCSLAWTQLDQIAAVAWQRRHFGSETDYLITTKWAPRTSAQAVLKMFKKWYAELGLHGCSSRSGRLALLTNAARKIGTVKGSLRGVYMIAAHSSLNTT
jgi:hypothetical protein